MDVGTDQEQLIAWLQKGGKTFRLLTDPNAEMMQDRPTLHSIIESKFEKAVVAWFFDKEGRLLQKTDETDLAGSVKLFTKMGFKPEVTTELPDEIKARYPGLVSMLTYHTPSGMRVRHYYNADGRDITNMDILPVPASRVEVPDKQTD